MTSEDFDQIVRQFQVRIDQLCVQRGAMYASSQDRLSNFKRAAWFSGTTPEGALLGMVTKHLVWIYDEVGKLKGPNPADAGAHQWEEKVGDVLVYMLLLAALVEERRKRE